MERSVSITGRGVQSCDATSSRFVGTVPWLQGITLGWMTVECAVSLYSAKAAHSAALLAFGTDSFVELLSALVALFSFIPSFPLTKERAARWAGILLFVLAAGVGAAAITALSRGIKPETSWAALESRLPLSSSCRGLHGSSEGRHTLPATVLSLRTRCNLRHALIWLRSLWRASA